MNKQYKDEKRRGISWTDYTWNPIRGCYHGCAWRMPDGSLASCYADAVATKLAASMYPQGFAHHYFSQKELAAPLSVKKPSRIFVGSMADVFGRWVPTEQIQAVLDVCKAAPWHQFQFLTKNPARLLDFVFPDNCWVGVSVPPSQMGSHELKKVEQIARLDEASQVLSTVKASVRWMSFEPLSFDVATLFDIQAPTLEWAVIGAASNGKTFYQPDPRWVKNLVTWLDDNHAAVFFKENLRSNAAADPWREEFPVIATMAESTLTGGRLFNDGR